jgi:hypothetical protein
MVCLKSFMIHSKVAQYKYNRTYSTVSLSGAPLLLDDMTPFSLISTLHVGDVLKARHFKMLQTLSTRILRKTKPYLALL